MDEPTADRIVKSRYTLARYKAMGVPEDDAHGTLKSMIREEIAILSSIKAKMDSDRLDPLIADWEELLKKVE